MYDLVLASREFYPLFWRCCFHKVFHLPSRGILGGGLLVLFHHPLFCTEFVGTVLTVLGL